MDEASLPDDAIQFDSLDQLESVELEDALAARVPRRQKLTRGALAVAALVIVLGALLRDALPLPHWSLAAARPAPTAVSGGQISHWQVRSGAGWAPGPVNIYSNVSYGTVTLNGVHLSGSPPLSVPSLAPGLNTVALDAVPFPPVSCTIYTIGTSGEGGTGYQTRNPCLVDGYGDRLNIYVYLSGANLPATTAARALSTLRVAVSQLPTEYADVPTGEYYATGISAAGAITYARAAEPLGALLEYAPDIAGTSSAGAIQLPGFTAPCDELRCGGVTFQGPLQTAAWLVSEPVLLRMRFVTGDGALKGALTLPGAVPPRFALAYRADGTWQTVNLDASVAGDVTPPAQCETGLNLLSARLDATQGGGGSLGAGATGHTLDGCQYSVATASGGTAVFVWRFGVLLAADASAHALLPALPIAPPSALLALVPPTLTAPTP
jgi:hypothetical protein